MATRKLEVVITGDPSGAQRAMRSVESGADSMGGKLSGIGSTVAGVFGGTMLTSAVQSAGHAIFDFAGGAIKGASDLSESMSKVGVVFGPLSDEMKAWSSTAATTLGMSQQKALEAAGTFGNLFSAMKIGAPQAADMSKGIIQLSADLASFNNASPEDVLLALRSGLVGETEPLRKFGINLSAARIEAYALESGLASTKDELTAGIKAQAAYQLILQDSTLAQGDFARTSEGAANSQRIASAKWEDFTTKVGTWILPVWQGFLGFIVDTALPAFERLATWVGDKVGPVFAELVPAIQAFVAAFMAGDGDITSSGMAGTFERIAGTAREVWDQIWAVAEVIKDVLGGAVAFVVEHFDTFKIVIGTVVGALLAYKAIVAAIKIVQIAVIASQIAWTVATNAGAIAQWALNAALNANPIGLVVMLLAALVAGAIWAYQNIDWFRQVVDDAWTGIQMVIDFAWNNIIKPVFNAIWWYIETILIPYYTMLWNIAVAVFQGIASVVQWAWDNVIKPVWDAIYGFVVNYLIPYWQELWNVAQQVWNGISGAISWAWSTISTVFGYITGGISTVMGWFTSLRDGISNAVSTVADIIWSPFKTAFNWIARGWNDTVGQLSFSIPDWVPGIGGKGFSMPKLPTYHTGGIFQAPTPGGEGLAMLRDGERILTPNQQGPMTSRVGGGGAPNITVELTVEGHVVTEQELVEVVRSGMIKAAKTVPGVYLPGVTV